MKQLLAAFLVLVCGVASAQARPTAICDRLAQAVEDNAKNLSYYRVSGIADDSAPRETNRLLQRVIYTNMLQSNLTLMQANKCALPSTPVVDDAYTSSALKCMTAKVNAHSKFPPECDQSSWVRDLAAPK